MNHDPLLERYSRQMLFAPIGPEGQDKLRRSRVAVVGMGALGTVLANHLVRAGIGELRLIDRDFVEPSNLQRQMLYDEDDARAAAPKAVAAAARLARINGDVRLEPHVADLNPATAEALLAGVDLVLDGTDNFAVRFLINDACVRAGVPWIYGGAVSSRGVTMTIVPGETPCLRCLYPQPPAPGALETCDTAGVIAPVVDIVASLQAAEAFKWLVGAKDRLRRGMTHIDLWHNQYAAVDLSGARRADCPCCGERRFEFLEAAAGEPVFQSLCGRDAVQIVPAEPRHVDLDAVAERLAAAGAVQRNPFLLRFRLSDAVRIVLFPDGRAMIQGTSDLAEARRLYAQYIGM